MTNKIEEMRKAFEELEKAINDVKIKYGDSVDTKYLKDKFEEMLKKID
tara:strand:- start:1656 stop:1799 length:144 start_codon:yes stop_codon:yes gene_type:complete